VCVCMCACVCVCVCVVCVCVCVCVRTSMCWQFWKVFTCTKQCTKHFYFVFTVGAVDHTLSLCVKRCDLQDTISTTCRVQQHCAAWEEGSTTEMQAHFICITEEEHRGPTKLSSTNHICRYSPPL